MLKSWLHRAALWLEKGADWIFRRGAHRRPGGREVDAYLGYATPQSLILRGRVLSHVFRAEARVDQSRLANLRNMIALFLTDEVSGVALRVGDVTTHSDEEGYFQLTLPRLPDLAGWSHMEVQVEGRAASVVCALYVPPPGAGFLVISDIDDTVLRTGAWSLWRNLYTSLTGNARTRHVFPDAVALMKALSADNRNPIYYVSSSPWNMHGFLSEVFEAAGLVRGPKFLRDLGLSEDTFITNGHGTHKGESIDEILWANPNLPVILLGDTGQKDAQIYRAAIDRHPGRIAAVVLRCANPDHGQGVDPANHADISDFKGTGVPAFAVTDFERVEALLAQARPDLFSAALERTRPA